MTKQILTTLAAILLLSGCTADPAALALNPTPVSETPDQPCEPNREAVFVAYHGSGSEIAIYCGEHPVEDSWLLNWAEEAITRDDSGELAEALGKNGTSIEVTTFYMELFLAADRACIENRGELAALIESYAGEFKSRPNVDFPLLSAAYLLSSEIVVPGRHNGSALQESLSESLRVDCSDKVSSFSDIPDPPPLCITHSSGGESLCFNEGSNVSLGPTFGQWSSESFPAAWAESS